MPESFVFNDVETEVPSSRGLPVENFAADDGKTGSCEPTFVVVHGVEFDEHAVFYEAKDFLVFATRQGFLFEPVSESECGAGFQDLGGVKEEAGNILIVGDRFDGPKHIEGFVEVHGFGVHTEESGRGAGLARGLVGHFDLRRREGDTNGLQTVLASKVDAAGAEPAADVQKSCARLNPGGIGEMLDQLQLRDFLRFIATNPITMMKMLAPKRAVIRTDTVVMVEDALFVVGPKHRATE